MKVFIVGYGEMLKALVYGVLNSGCDIAGVFRHDNVIMSPFKRFLFDVFLPSEDCIFVKTLKLPEIYAKSVNSLKFRKLLKQINPDVIIVGSWSEKLLSETINLPKIACINVHPALLPKYRGPNPYIQTILADEKYSGVTFHLVNLNYDSGKILHQAQIPIDVNETGQTLKHKCCNLAEKEVKILLENLPDKLESAQIQDERLASYQKQISISESVLNFKEETSSQISRRIRAFYPWLSCHISYKNEFFEFKEFKILGNSELEPSTIAEKTCDSLSIVCKDLKIIQFSGLKLKRSFINIFSKIYIKYFVKINSKVN